MACTQARANRKKRLHRYAYLAAELPASAAQFLDPARVGVFHVTYAVCVCGGEGEVVQRRRWEGMPNIDLNKKGMAITHAHGVSRMSSRPCTTTAVQFSG